MIDKVIDIAREADEEKDAVVERLSSVSNKKLLRLAEVGKVVKDKYGGSKDKLVAAVSQAVGKAKDKDYVARLSSYSAARLLDLAQSAERRTRRAAAAVKAKAAPKAAKPKTKAKSKKAS
ncbi:MAG TPA: hypothetical protein VMZ28_15790 [Kofleriaceae bacterium]|nr:hypothetical protein [Kofleriaceae bacterium]